MGLPFRSIRAAASVLLVAAAVGTGGMTGIGSALAAGPSTVSLTGTVVDGSGAALGGVHLVITEELAPDGGLAAFQTATAADGSFAADLYAWGTADAPATVSIATPAGEEREVAGGSCSRTWAVTVKTDAQLALADSAPEPLTVTASTTLVGEVCGTTATPPPANHAGGWAGLTPPPTDAFARTAGTASERHGPALTIGFVVGLLLATLVLLPRRKARRRD